MVKNKKRILEVKLFQIPSTFIIAAVDFNGSQPVTFLFLRHTWPLSCCFLVYFILILSLDFFSFSNKLDFKMRLLQLDINQSRNKTAVERDRAKGAEGEAWVLLVAPFLIYMIITALLLYHTLPKWVHINCAMNAWLWWY